MLVGLDRLASCASLVRRLRSQRVGLLAHAPSVNRDLSHISAVLAASGIQPTRIFGPEHGYGGEAQDMIGVEDAVDRLSGAPIVSLYGESFDELSPRAEHLQGLDSLIVDLCDVGSRYYTFVWTAVLCLRAAAQAGVHCVVLDRPNPIGGQPHDAEGAPGLASHLSFVGLEPIPVRHGLTVGELVAEIASRDGLPLGESGALEVVSVQGWKREEHADRWDRPFVIPSPNMPTLDTARVYPGGCLLEGTNLSEGRGTTRPFELLGAPWLDGFALAQQFAQLNLPGVVARPVTFRPTFHKHAGAVCGGIQVHITQPSLFRPMTTYLAVIAIAHRLAPEAFRFRTERYEFVDTIPALDLLVGRSQTRHAIERGATVQEVIDTACPVDPSYEEMHAAAVARIAGS